MQGVFLSSTRVLKALVPGRIITVFIAKYRYLLAAVIQRKDRSISVLFLCNKEDATETSAQTLIDETEKYLSTVHVYEQFKQYYLPELPLKHIVTDIPSHFLVNIMENVVKIDPSRVINDYKKRQIPRFK